MEKLLLEIINNATEPVLITCNNIIEITEAVLEETKVRIYFKHHVFEYFNHAGYYRKRLLKNTFEVWIKKDVEDLQHSDLLKLGINDD